MGVLGGGGDVVVRGVGRGTVKGVGHDDSGTDGTGVDDSSAGAGWMDGERAETDRTGTGRSKPLTPLTPLTPLKPLSTSLSTTRGGVSGVSGVSLAVVAEFSPGLLPILYPGRTYCEMDQLQLCSLTSLFRSPCETCWPSRGRSTASKATCARYRARAGGGEGGHGAQCMGVDMHSMRGSIQTKTRRATHSYKRARTLDTACYAPSLLFVFCFQLCLSVLCCYVLSGGMCVALADVTHCCHLC